MPNPVEIWTDYKNLKYFITGKKLNCKQVQWTFYLARFDFVLYHYLNKFIDKLDILFQRPDYVNGLYDNKNVILLKLGVSSDICIKRTGIQRRET